jgi:hypothetical protein
VNARNVHALAGVIHAAMQTRQTAAGIAAAVEAAGMLQSPETAAELATLRAEVERLRLSPHERLILRFALEMADDAIASTPADFTAEDTAAMGRLRAFATGPTVAYRNPWRPGVLLCLEHGEGWEGMKPLSVEDLPDGGTCTAGDPADPDDVCGRDVLATSKDGA